MMMKNSNTYVNQGVFVVACLFVVLQSVAISVASYQLYLAGNDLIDFSEKSVQRLVDAAVQRDATMNVTGVLEGTGHAGKFHLLPHGRAHTREFRSSESFAKRLFETSFTVFDSISKIGVHGFVDLIHNTTAALDTVANFNTTVLSVGMEKAIESEALWDGAKRLIDDIDAAKDMMTFVLSLVKTNVTNP